LSAAAWSHGAGAFCSGAAQPFTSAWWSGSFSEGSSWWVAAKQRASASAAAFWRAAYPYTGSEPARAQCSTVVSFAQKASLAWTSAGETVVAGPCAPATPWAGGPPAPARGGATEKLSCAFFDPEPNVFPQLTSARSTSASTASARDGASGGSTSVMSRVMPLG